MEPLSDIKAQFGEAVRHARARKHLSQEELADLCGLDRSYLGGIERGQRNLGLIAIGRIANALNIEISELFLGVSNGVSNEAQGDNC